MLRMMMLGMMRCRVMMLRKMRLRMMMYIKDDDDDDDDDDDVKGDEEDRRLGPRRTLCVSLRSPDGLQHFTGATFIWKVYMKMPRPSQIEPRMQTHTLCEPASRNTCQHVTRSTSCRNLQKRRAPAGPQKQDPRFVRACAIEIHVD